MKILARICNYISLYALFALAMLAVVALVIAIGHDYKF
jgi:hypothetical protein